MSTASTSPSVLEESLPVAKSETNRTRSNLALSPKHGPSTLFARTSQEPPTAATQASIATSEAPPLDEDDHIRHLGGQLDDVVGARSVLSQELLQEAKDGDTKDEEPGEPIHATTLWIEDETPSTNTTTTTMPTYTPSPLTAPSLTTAPPPTTTAPPPTHTSSPPSMLVETPLVPSVAAAPTSTRTIFQTSRTNERSVVQVLHPCVAAEEPTSTIPAASLIETHGTHTPSPTSQLSCLTDAIEALESKTTEEILESAENQRKRQERSRHQQLAQSLDSKKVDPNQNPKNMLLPLVTRFQLRQEASQRRQQRESETLEAERLAQQAASLAAQIIASPEVAKQLLLSMALVRTNPRTPPSTWPVKGSVIPVGFFWATYPPLEGILRDSMQEYYELSVKKCQSKAQQRFNNSLVKTVRKEAKALQWKFSPKFSDKLLRDRIRCFFKTHIQNAKKRLRTMVKNPTKRANAKALVVHYDLIQKYSDAPTTRDSETHHVAQVMALGFQQLSQDQQLAKV